MALPNAAPVGNQLRRRSDTAADRMTATVSTANVAARTSRSRLMSAFHSAWRNADASTSVAMASELIQPHPTFGVAFAVRRVERHLPTLAIALGTQFALLRTK